MRVAIIIAAMCLLCATVQARTLKVPAEFPTIQAAIDAAAAGDAVLVAPGTYAEIIDFNGKGIVLKGVSGPEATTLDGKHAGSVVTCQSGEEADTVLDGFTIKNGKAPPGANGGMYNSQSNPTVQNCIFKLSSRGMQNEHSNPRVFQCEFIQNARGMFNEYSHPTITQCDFSYNYGSAITNQLLSGPEMVYCTFFKNGYGMDNLNSSPTVTQCVFKSNDWGIECQNSSLTVTYSLFHMTMRGINGDGSDINASHCTFSYNQACGMELWGGSAKVADCIFLNNVENDGYGGAIDFVGNSASVANSLFVANKAIATGGAIWGVDKVAHCTFYGNSAQSGGALDDCGDVNHCVLWNNQPDQASSGCGQLRWCCIQGGFPGIGNIDADPMFADAEAGDFHLQFRSPCRNAGNSSIVTEPFDFEGDPRIAEGTVDIGADEFYRHLYIAGNMTPGGDVQINLVGWPATAPLALIFGAGVLGSPVTTHWGLFYLQPPCLYLALAALQIPDEGILSIPATIPLDPAAPYDLPMQALIGLKFNSLSNLEVLEVR